LRDIIAFGTFRSTFIFARNRILYVRAAITVATLATSAATATLAFTTFAAFAFFAWTLFSGTTWLTSGFLDFFNLVVEIFDVVFNVIIVEIDNRR
jgi:hypothetical protein